MRTKGVTGGTFGLLAVLAIVGLSACDFWPQPTGPTQTVIVTTNQNTGPQANPSPVAGDNCSADKVVLGTADDDRTVTADGEDSILLVPSLLQGLVELPAICASSAAVQYAITGACGLSGANELIATAPGTCTVVASFKTVPSQPITITAVP